MKIRRVVTGHDQNGKAIVSHDELCTNILSRRDFHQSCVVWSTGKLPVDNSDPADGYSRDVSVLGKEDSVFRIVQYDPGVAPRNHRTETIDYAVVMAGSIDMVYRNRHDGTFAIYDWKRSKEIKTENSFQSGLGPLAHLPDTNFWHYSLQLNLYRWLLETHYGIRISKMALVVLHPNNPGPKVYPLNRMDDEIEDMVAARRRAVAEGGRSPVVF